MGSGKKEDRGAYQFLNGSIKQNYSLTPGCFMKSENKSEDQDPMFVEANKSLFITTVGMGSGHNMSRVSYPVLK